MPLISANGGDVCGATRELLAAADGSGNLSPAVTIVDSDGNSLANGDKARRFCERESMGTTASGEDIWRGNELSPAPTSHTSIPIPFSSGEQMTVVSENVNDTTVGTGARRVAIKYLDSTGAEQTTTVDLDGATPVDLTPSDVRFVNDFYVTIAGSGGVSAGHIKIYSKADSGLVYDMIAAGGNKSMVPHCMVPLGKVLKLDHWHAEEAQGKRCAIRIRADCTPDGVRQAGVYLFKDVVYLNKGPSGSLPIHDEIPALSIIKISAWPDAALAECSAGWHGRLVDVV